MVLLNCYFAIISSLEKSGKNITKNSSLPSDYQLLRFCHIYFNAHLHSFSDTHPYTSEHFLPTFAWSHALYFKLGWIGQNCLFHSWLCPGLKQWFLRNNEHIRSSTNHKYKNLLCFIPFHIFIFLFPHNTHILTICVKLYIELCIDTYYYNMLLYIESMNLYWYFWLQSNITKSILAFFHSRIFTLSLCSENSGF